VTHDLALLPGPGDAPALELSDISVRFGGVVALDQVSLTVRTGEIVGVIGPNGAGKTTLLNVITGIVRPSQGSVWLTGRDCTRWAVHRRARLGLARTFQRVTLYPELTIGDHLRLATEARQPLWRYGPRSAPGGSREYLDLIGRFGWEIQGTETIGGLPLGRARLVELAMSMLADPCVLLLDEPLSGLAGSERDAIADAVRELRERSSVSVLIVEHDLESVARLADRLVVLDFGKKISDGVVDAVLSDEAVRTAYFGRSTA